MSRGTLASNQDAIVMAALKLSKAHTRWMTGKGSIKSFSRAKGDFIRILQIELSEVHEKGCSYIEWQSERIGELEGEKS